MNVTITKTKSAQIMGVRKLTGVDEQKKSADFRIIYTGKKHTIQWNSGLVEHVTDRKLEKLQASHSWATDY